MIVMSNELTNYITNWNIKYPFDKAWRSKHKIPFLSIQHKQMCLIDILLEQKEDKVYEDLRAKYLKEQKGKEELSIIPLRDREYIPGEGNYLKPREDSMSEKEVEDLFDKITF